MFFLFITAGLAPGVKREMFFVIIARLPERGAGFRGVLSFLFASLTNHAAAPLAGRRLKRINTAATGFVDNVLLSALPWGKLG